MGIFDLNRAIEHKRTRVFTSVILVVLTLFLLLFGGYLILNNKHNKLPGGIETNIPVSSDTIPPVINNTQKTEININENKGDINIGDKK